MAEFGDIFLNISTVLIALITLAAYALYKTTKRPECFPPGPAALPLLGNITAFMTKPTSEVFDDLRRKYGDIFSLKFGTWDLVMLSGIDVVKEALVKKGVEFAGRPLSYSAEVFTEGYKDIAFSDYGKQWRYQRKLGHTAIRHFAQNEQLERLVFSVTPGITKALDEVGNKPFAPKYTIGIVVYNILAAMCFGKRYELNDPELLNWIQMNVDLQQIIGSGLAADYIPIFRYIPTPTVRKFKKLIGNMLAIFYKELEHHRKKFDPEKVGDFMDSLLLTQAEAIEAGDEDASGITDVHIVQTVADIFGAGTETTTLTLHWAVGLLVEHPDIQDKIAMEIDEVIGRDSLPSLADRGSLPYTEATILETFRYGSVAPVGVPHSTTADTTLCGYKIPKGTTIMINHMALHYDPKVWDEPEKFRPERFLQENGQLLAKLPESFFPFSAGRRVCLGEDFAKKEVFLLFTWLFQRYTFSKVPGQESKSVLELNTSSGFLHQPLDEMEVCVKKRFYFHKES